MTDKKSTKKDDKKSVEETETVEETEAVEETATVEDYTPMPTNNTKKRVQISVAVEADTAEKLDNIFFDARGKYRSRNDLVRHALEEFVTKHAMVDSEPTESSK